jgi:hypothetical protein
VKFQVGDWVRTETGQEVQVSLLCENGRELYVTVWEGERGMRLVKLEIAGLTKTDRPDP